MYPIEVTLILMMCTHTEKHIIKYTSTVFFTIVVLLDPSSGNQAVCVAHGTVTRLGYMYIFLTYLVLKHGPAASGGGELFMKAVCTFASEESLQKSEAADLIGTCTSL